MKFVVVNPETGEFVGEESFIQDCLIWRASWVLDIDDAQLFTQKETEEFLEYNTNMTPEWIVAVGIFELTRGGYPKFLDMPLTVKLDDPELQKKLTELMDQPMSYSFTSSPATTVHITVDCKMPEVYPCTHCKESADVFECARPCRAYDLYIEKLTGGNKDDSK